MSRGFRLTPAAWWRVGATALLAALIWVQVSSGSAAAKPIVHTVAIDAVAFNPQTLTVNSGDVVMWVNKDPFPHTVTSQTGAFDSKSIAADKSWRFTTKAKGEFPYTCTLHPTMKAVLVVK